MESAELIDREFSGAYAAESYPGIAWRIRGFATRETEEEHTEEAADGGTLYSYETVLVEDRERVRAVMCGDDREFILETEEIRALEEDDWCAGCGQIGCGWC